MTKIVEAVRPSAEQRIASERGAIVDVEREIAELEKQRRAALLADDPGRPLKLAEQIAAAHRQLETHRERIEALQGEIRRQAQLAADRERADRVAVTETALRERDAIAVKLETAIADMGRLYFEIIDQNVVISRLWGMSNNARRVGALGESIIRREVGNALFAAGRPQGGTCRLPAPTTVGLGIVGDDDGTGLAGRIAAASAALLEMVRAVPILAPEDEVA